MKKLLIILLFISQNAFCQEHKCPVGYKWFGTFSFDYVTWTVNDCLPDSAINSLYESIAKEICGFGGTSNGNSNHFESHYGKWDDSLKKCVSVDEYKIKVKNKWVDIPKSRYDSLFQKHNVMEFKSSLK